MSHSTLSPGVQDSVVALLAEGTPVREISRRYALSHAQVQRLAKRLSEIDVEHVQMLRRGLPGLQTTLSAAMAAKAMDLLDDDPATAVKLAFGSKLSIEATRLSQPASEAPGRVVLNVIGGQVMVAAPMLATPVTPDMIVGPETKIEGEWVEASLMAAPLPPREPEPLAIEAVAEVEAPVVAEPLPEQLDLLNALDP